MGLVWFHSNSTVCKKVQIPSSIFVCIMFIFLLSDLFPFAVDASVFREQYQTRVAVVKSELVRYLVCNKGMVSDTDEAADKVERHLQDLFWQLVELRAQPHNMRMCVLAHG